MKKENALIALVCGMLVLSALVGCKNKDYEGDDTVYRSVTLRLSETSQNALESATIQKSIAPTKKTVSAFETNLASTTLPANVTSVYAVVGYAEVFDTIAPNYESAIASSVTSGKLELTNYSVNLSLPLEKSLIVFVFAFEGETPGSTTVAVGKSTPLSITAATTEIDVDIGLDVFNALPISFSESLTLNEDVSTEITLTASDINGDDLTFQIVAPPTHGSLSGEPPVVVYTPSANYNGTDSFSFLSNDGKADSEVATVSLSVTPVNDAPIAASATILVDEDTVSAGVEPTVTDVDLDFEGDAYTFAVVTQPAYGTATVVDNRLVYTPNANYNGSDSFDYRVTDAGGLVVEAIAAVTVNPVNDIPVADEIGVSAVEETMKSITLTGTDVEGSTLTFSVVTPPQHGDYSIVGDQVEYTPTLNYFGADLFTFSVNDGTDESEPATVNITVANVNDPPVASISLPHGIVLGFPVKLDGSGSNDLLDEGTVSFDWTLLSGPTTNITEATSNIAFFRPWSVGTYNIQVVVTDTDLTTATASATITVGAFSGGYVHSFDLKPSGELWVWGNNSFYQMATTMNYQTPYLLDTGWAAIATGRNHNVAIKSDGTLWSWGRNDNGQLGLGHTSTIATPTQVGTATWNFVDAKYYNSIAIRGDGTLWAWGDNSYGQLGDGCCTDSSVPYQIGTQNDWAMVAGGGLHHMALQSDGTLWTWGANGAGQLGIGNLVDTYYPTQVGNIGEWSSIAAGYYHTVGIKKDGSLWTWGYNAFGHLGLGDTTNRDLPTQVGTDTDWVAVRAGEHHTVALKTDGTLWAWGRNSDGQVGDATGVAKYFPTQICAADDESCIQVLSDIADFGVGESHNFARKSDGSVVGWGKNAFGEIGDGLAWHASPTFVTDSVAKIASGRFHSLYIATDGSLWSWGWNFMGALGIGGDGKDRNAPVQVGTDTTWDFPGGFGGYNHSAAIQLNGGERTLWAWGYNTYGQLGLGNTTHQYYPTQVGADTDWSVVAYGNNHMLAIREDVPTGNRTLWAWGLNSSGQLGLGDNTTRYSPVQVGTAVDWDSVYSGSGHALAIRDDGGGNRTLWAWGRGDYGQLGDGCSVGTNCYGSTTPNQVGIDTNWLKASAGDVHSIGLKTDGTLWGWGNNGQYQLGMGNTTTQTSPVQIGTDTNWSDIVANYYTSYALKTDGTLWAWGNNTAEQTGQTNTVLVSTPNKVGSESYWAAIAAGDYHLLMLTTTGNLYSIGLDGNGQLGLGTGGPRFYPRSITEY